MREHVRIAPDRLLVSRHLHRHFRLLYIDHLLPLLHLHLVLRLRHVVVPAVPATSSIVVIAAATAMVVVGRAAAVTTSIVVELSVVLTSLAVVAPIKDLVKVVVLKRFTLKDKVWKTSADFAKDTSSAGSVTDTATILGGKVGLHRFDQTDSLCMG